MKSADQKIYVSDTAQYTAVSKFAGGYEMVILGNNRYFVWNIFPLYAMSFGYP